MPLTASKSPKVRRRPRAPIRRHAVDAGEEVEVLVDGEVVVE